MNAEKTDLASSWRNYYCDEIPEWSQHRGRQSWEIKRDQVQMAWSAPLSPAVPAGHPCAFHRMSPFHLCWIYAGPLHRNSLLSPALSFCSSLIDHSHRSASILLCFPFKKKASLDSSLLFLLFTLTFFKWDVHTDSLQFFSFHSLLGQLQLDFQSIPVNWNALVKMTKECHVTKPNGQTSVFQSVTFDTLDYSQCLDILCSLTFHKNSCS